LRAAGRSLAARPQQLADDDDPVVVAGASLPSGDSRSFAGSSLASRYGEPTGLQPYRACGLALGARKVADPVRIAAVRHWRAVGGDVVGHELP
jgi:hypothetical protein